MAHTPASEVEKPKVNTMKRETLPEITPRIVHETIRVPEDQMSSSLDEDVGSSYSTESKRGSYGSFPASVASRMGLDGRGVTWDSRWVVLIAALWLQCNSGLHYSFSMYSNDLKTILNYSQQQTDGLGSAKDLGASLGIISGIVFDMNGPRRTLLIGSILNLCGYLVVWLAVTNSVPVTLSYWQMCLTIAIACNGQTWFDTAAVVSSLRNFPDDRGTVAGLVKCFVGLSAAIYTQIYIGLFAPKVDHFVLLIAILPAVVGLAVMTIIKLVPAKSYDGESCEDKAERFKLAKILVVVLGLYLLGVTGFQQHWKTEQRISFLLMVVMLAILAMPALIPFRTCMPVCLPELTSPPLSPTSPGLSDRSPLLPNWRESETKGAEKKKDLTLWEAVGNLNFWLLFYVATCSTGAGLTVINNLAQIVTALGGAAPFACLSLISVANCLGRLAAGCWSEELLHKYGVPRPYFLVAASSTMCLAQALLAYANLGALYSCVLLVGFSYGCHLSLLPTITSELFGLTHFGTLYNFFGLSMATGSFLLSTCLAGYFYDHNSDAALTVCMGPQCFRPTFLICSGVCCSAVFASLLLVKRTRKSYRSEYRRLKHK
eukprot:TRINITY_DN706_c0_g1_i2.p1 TRINITY_DN706_c0_g1~~TRINITY_DN706_c0_g1_i2.p1  ORF type:complete len:601 (+),score=104.52 TRINITY_DN706_c0_g1_i2:271-2073(+)